MKRLFLLFAVLAVVATSCQKDTAESFNSGFANSPSNAITMEKACDNLKNILRDIDPQTRGSIRTIRDIKPFLSVRSEIILRELLNKILLNFYIW